MDAAVVQLVRMPPCHGGGRGFEPRPLRHLVSLAQPVEHLPFKEGAVGSNPTRDTIFIVRVMTLSSSGPGQHSLCVETEVQIL